MPGWASADRSRTLAVPSMIITKADRRTIYEALFKDGVLVAKKDYVSRPRANSPSRRRSADPVA